VTISSIAFVVLGLAHTSTSINNKDVESVIVDIASSESVGGGGGGVVFRKYY
jgi:hypothetical protein